MDADQFAVLVLIGLVIVFCLLASLVASIRRT